MEVDASIEQFDLDDIEVRLEWTRPCDAGVAAGSIVKATWIARTVEDALASGTRFAVNGKPRIKVAATGKTIWWTGLTDAERVAIRKAAEDILGRFSLEKWWWAEVAYQNIWRFP